jgi:hypothetical protein
MIGMPFRKKVILPATKIPLIIATKRGYSNWQKKSKAKRKNFQKLWPSM